MNNHTPRAPLVIYAPIVLGILAVGAGIFSRWNTGRQDQLKSRCSDNLHVIGFAIHQYQMDYSGRFPLVAYSDVPSAVPPYTSPFGWADAIYPYAKTTSWFNCPSASTPQNLNPTQPGFTNYWFNGNLSGREEFKDGTISSTIMVGDGLPANSRSSRTTPMPATGTTFENRTESYWRHFGKANILLADGAINTYRPDQISTQKGAPYTFYSR